MANTYALIETQTLASSQTSITFSGIPQVFDDLILTCSLRDSRVSTGPGYLRFNFNGDTASTLYFRRNAFSNQDTGYSGNFSSGNDHYASFWATGNTQSLANTFGNVEVKISGYRRAISKGCSIFTIQETNSATFNNAGVNVAALQWNNNSAITSITLIPGDSPYTIYSSASLYGISNS